MSIDKFIVNSSNCCRLCPAFHMVQSGYNMRLEWTGFCIHASKATTSLRAQHIRRIKNQHIFNISHALYITLFIFPPQAKNKPHKGITDVRSLGTASKAVSMLLLIQKGVKVTKRPVTPEGGQLVCRTSSSKKILQLEVV
jgi:hypothetical protein